MAHRASLDNRLALARCGHHCLARQGKALHALCRGGLFEGRVRRRTEGFETAVAILNIFCLRNSTLHTAKQLPKLPGLPQGKPAGRVRAGRLISKAPGSRTLSQATWSRRRPGPAPTRLRPSRGSPMGLIPSLSRKRRSRRFNAWLARSSDRRARSPRARLASASSIVRVAGRLASTRRRTRRRVWSSERLPRARRRTRSILGRKPQWTLPMTLAWIGWRSFEEVREWDADYLSGVPGLDDIWRSRPSAEKTRSAHDARFENGVGVRLLRSSVGRT